MITGGKIAYVEARKESEDPAQGLNINIGLDEINCEGRNVNIKYTYVASYLGDTESKRVGYLKINGSITAEEDAKTVKEVSEKWKAEKILPPKFAELVLTTINYTCGSNGTLVVRPLNLSPPMIPPKIELTAKQ